MDPNNQPLQNQEPSTTDANLVQSTNQFQPSVPAPSTVPQYAPQPVAAITTQKDPGHGLGIASLITSLLGLGLVGVVLGIIAMSRSKKSGHGTNVMALIGLIWGVVSSVVILPILAGLVLNNFNGAQQKARDSTSISRMNSVHSKLEEYYNENSSYPEAIGVTNLMGLEASSLRSGNEIQLVEIKGAKTEAEALAKAAPTESEPYQYIPFNCVSGECRGYVLRVFIYKPSSVFKNPYTKRGLQN